MDYNEIEPAQISKRLKKIYCNHEMCWPSTVKERSNRYLKTNQQCTDLERRVGNIRTFEEQIRETPAIVLAVLGAHVVLAAFSSVQGRTDTSLALCRHITVTDVTLQMTLHFDYALHLQHK